MNSQAAVAPSGIEQSARVRFDGEASPHHSQRSSKTLHPVPQVLRLPFESSSQSGDSVGLTVDRGDDPRDIAAHRLRRTFAVTRRLRDRDAALPAQLDEVLVDRPE